MYLNWFREGKEPIDSEAVNTLRNNVARYTLIQRVLYKEGFLTPLLRCLGELKKERIVHEDVCGRHIGGRCLAVKVLRAGFFFSTLRNICLWYVKKCDKCQQHSNEIKVPTERLYSLVSPWPFYKWGIDILGTFPMSIRQFKFIVVAIKYFTKWIELEPLTTKK